MMKGSWLKDEIDPDLLDRGVPMFTEGALTETTLTLNRRWFVEWEDTPSSMLQRRTQEILESLIGLLTHH